MLSASVYSKPTTLLFIPSPSTLLPHFPICRGRVCSTVLGERLSQNCAIGADRESKPCSGESLSNCALLATASHLHKQSSPQVPTLWGTARGGLCGRFTLAACGSKNTKSTCQISPTITQQLMLTMLQLFHMIMMGNSNQELTNVLISKTFQTAISPCSVYSYYLLISTQVMISGGN